MRASLCNVVWFVFLCVFVLMCACVLCLMPVHAVCELSCDDVWCSMCVLCVCVWFWCLCGLSDLLCDVVWYVYVCVMCGVVCVVCCCVLLLIEYV